VPKQQKGSCTGHAAVEYTSTYTSSNGIITDRLQLESEMIRAAKQLQRSGMQR
jgi:hypothetical protein